jgi:antitoxin component YwqK of YwqJK toxin-antitoxin module
MGMLKQKIIILILVGGMCLWACKSTKPLMNVEEPETWLETIVTTTHKTECHVLMGTTDIKPDVDKEYYWYDKNKIEITHGYVGGRLLHGETRVYDKMNHLLEKQEYKNGLKEGIWVAFFENGKTQKIEQWKEGKLHGKTFEYTEDGTLVLETMYKNGKLIEEDGYGNNEPTTEQDTTLRKKNK